MKKLLPLTAIGLVLLGVAQAAQLNEADQKWLQVVEKKVSAGQTQVSTPAAERVRLLKEWAIHNGYSTQVTQFGVNYRIELLKAIAQK